MDMNRVEAFRRHYQEKSQKNPDLYRSGDHAVDVILPNDLLEYANAASGHSGFGSGARARGIRRECRNSTKFLSEIFETTESLARFLASSEQNAEAYIETVRERHALKSQPRIIMANDSKEGFWSKYNKDTLAQIRSKIKNPRELTEDFQNMTLSDFESKYALAA